MYCKVKQQCFRFWQLFSDYMEPTSRQGLHVHTLAGLQYAGTVAYNHSGNKLKKACNCYLQPMKRVLSPIVNGPSASPNIHKHAMSTGIMSVVYRSLTMVQAGLAHSSSLLHTLLYKASHSARLMHCTSALGSGQGSNGCC